LCQDTKQQYKQLFTPFFLIFIFTDKKRKKFFEHSDFFLNDYFLFIDAPEFELAGQKMALTLKMIELEEK
jgi:hypothetical protein